MSSNWPNEESLCYNLAHSAFDLQFVYNILVIAATTRVTNPKYIIICYTSVLREGRNTNLMCMNLFFKMPAVFDSK